MISGVVYFDEIVEHIKDATDIQNTMPLYDRFRRFIFHIEREIGAGGLIVRKKKQFTKGDGWYDGKNIVLPTDFIGENTMFEFSAGVINGNVVSLYNEGPEEIDIRYMGFLLDNNGNPITTRNHLVAVIAYSVYRLYSSKVFHGNGNLNLYHTYRQEYYDAVAEARGEDAWPTEEQWSNIGRTLNGGTFEAMTDCGFKTIPYGTEDPIVLNEELPPAAITCVAQISGTANGKATVIGDITYNIKGELEGIISGIATVTGHLTEYITPERALIGSANGVASVSGDLSPSIPVVLCNESFTYNGSKGTFQFVLDLGTAVGMAGIHFWPYSIADRFRIEWNGQEVANSKFRGTDSTSNRNALLALVDEFGDPLYNEGDLALGYPTDGDLLFYKSSAGPSQAIVYVDAPLGGTYWRIDGICPITAMQGQATAGGTLSAIGQLQGTINSVASLNN
jgi:hypothetical protein